MEELQVIKKELTLIKTQIDGLLDSLDRMDTQRNDHKGETLIQEDSGGRQVWDQMIDNLFTHQKHFKASSCNMPLSDFCLISFSSHSSNQNDLGSVPQGTQEMGVHYTSKATPVLPDKSIIFLQSGFFKRWIEGKITWSGGDWIYGCEQIMEHAEQTPWLKKVSDEQRGQPYTNSALK